MDEPPIMITAAEEPTDTLETAVMVRDLTTGEHHVKFKGRIFRPQPGTYIRIPADNPDILEEGPSAKGPWKPCQEAT